MRSAADRELTGSITGVRLVALVATALASLWLSLAVTTGLVYTPRYTAVSVPGWHSATAEAKAAVAMLQQGQQASDLDRASVIAHRALRRDPLNVVAARALGVVAAFRGRQNTARRWFGYAHWLSRRDLPTQLWLIEDAVAQGNIELALRHYNYALSTNSLAEQLLFPILINASADPAIIQPLAALLRERPLWRGSFIDALVSNGPSADGLVTLVSAAELNLRNGTERQLAARTIRQLLRINAVPEAFTLYQRLTGARDEGVRNGGFQRDNFLPPLDWELTNEPDLFATIADGPNDRHPRVLNITATNGKGGVAAKQLLHLKPGRYVLSALVGGQQIDLTEPPELQIACRSSASRLVNLPFSASDGDTGIRVAAAFEVVGSNCAFQWLRTSIRGSIESRTTEAWITDLSVQPR